MRYDIQIKEQAIEDLKCLLHNEPKAYKKALQLIDELYEHPTSGTGPPKLLKGCGTDRWSRRITQKHRLVYDINLTEVTVVVLMALGHYDDK